MPTSICPECGKAVALRNGSCPSCLLMLAFRDENQPAETEGAAVGDVIGRYRLVDPVGEGAFGTVWLAEQEHPVRRSVALKLLKPGMNSREVLRRFEGERQALALMDHPHIARILDGGATQTGRPFLVMEFVRGIPITEFCDRKRLSIPERLRIFLLLCDAVQHAHYKGIIHRDLKPGNILVTDSEIGPYPKVIDFGVAKAVEDPLTKETIVTRFQQFLGTPAYMSPEQFGIGDVDIDTRSDVYSLGALLYELLAGRTPFADRLSEPVGLEELLRILRETEPKPPSAATKALSESERNTVATQRGVTADRLAVALREELDWIVLKALEKERPRRYQSPSALAKDIQSHLEDGLVEATAPSLRYQVTKYVRRNRVAVFLGFVVVAALALGMGVTLWQRHRALKTAEMLRRELYIAGVRLAFDAWKEGNLKQAQAFLSTTESDLRDYQWRHLKFLCQDEAVATFTNAYSRISVWEFGVSRPLIPPSGGSGIISSRSNDFVVLNPADGTANTLFTSGGILKRYAFAARRPGRRVLLTDTITVRDERNQLLMGGGPLKYPSQTMSLSADGNLLAAVGNDGRMRVVDVESGELVTPELDLRGRNISNPTFSPDSRFLVCSTESASILVLTVSPLAIHGEWGGHTAFIQSFAFDSVSRRLASSANDGHVRLWSFPDGKELLDIPAHFGRVSQVCFSPDDRLLATGGWDSTVRIWDLGRPSEPTYLRGHRGPVGAIAFSPDGKQLYTAADDQTVKVWLIPSAEPTNILKHTRWVNDVAFSRDGRWLAAEDYHARATVLWDVHRREKVANLIVHSPHYYGGRVRFSPDGRLVATAGQDSNVVIWDTRDRKLALELAIRGGSEGNPPAFIAFHPSKPLMAVGRYDLELWDLSSTNRMSYLEGQAQKGVTALAFSPDGRWLAIGTPDSQVLVWNVKTGRQVATYQPSEPRGSVGTMAFSRDGDLIAFSLSDHRILILDIDQRRVIKTVEGHSGNIGSMEFTPDNKSIASASYDGTIRFWYVSSGQMGLTLTHGGGAVSSIAFSPDGNLMATAGADGLVRLWPAASF